MPITTIPHCGDCEWQIICDIKTRNDKPRMKLTMKVDEKQLMRTLAKSRKQFGESSEQAVYRWGVQISRELAGSTQAFGKGKKAQGIQEAAIWKDAFKVCKLVEKNGELKSPADAYNWIEQNRVRARRRTSFLPENERKTVTRAVLESALHAKIERVGMAKGAWLGGGLDLSDRQTGQQKVKIGKNFLGYAQKFADMGKAIKRISIFKPNVSLQNNVEHSSDQTVLSDKRKRDVVKRSLINTIKWYDRATTKALAK
jgi:hypothetical protein